jgi:hypothetical protein
MHVNLIARERVPFHVAATDIHADDDWGDSMKRPGHRWQKAVAHAVASIVVPAAAVITLVSPGVAAATSNAATVAASSSLPCTAAITKRYPADGSSVGVRVSTAPSAHIAVTAHFKYANREKTGRADENGHRTFWYRIGNATPGFRVKVDVSVSHLRLSFGVGTCGRRSG